MTDTLTALGLEVGRAQLDNDNGSMMDTFFVQKLSGKKIESGAHTSTLPGLSQGLKQRAAWGFADTPLQRSSSVRWQHILHLAGS